MARIFPIDLIRPNRETLVPTFARTGCGKGRGEGKLSPIIIPGRLFSFSPSRSHLVLTFFFFLKERTSNPISSRRRSIDAAVCRAGFTGNVVERSNGGKVRVAMQIVGVRDRSWPRKREAEPGREKEEEEEEDTTSGTFEYSSRTVS